MAIIPLLGLSWLSPKMTIITRAVNRGGCVFEEAVVIGGFVFEVAVFLAQMYQETVNVTAISKIAISPLPLFLRTT